MTFHDTSASGTASVVPKKYVEKVGDDGFKKAPIAARPKPEMRAAFLSPRHR